MQNIAEVLKSVMSVLSHSVVNNNIKFAQAVRDAVKGQNRI